MPRLNVFLLFIGVLLGTSLSGQSVSGDIRTDVRLLKQLSDAEHIQTALDFSVQYTQQGNWKMALELLDVAVSKARRVGGKTAAATVHLEYVDAMVNCCIEKATIQRMAAESLQAAFALKENGLINDRLENQLRQLNTNTRSPVIQSMLFRLAEQIDPAGQLTKELQASTLSEVERRQLTDRSEMLNTEVLDQEEELQSLNTAAARQRALAEYHKKIADSLFYVAMIDSLQVVQQERELAEQAATIDLQRSQLALRSAESRMMKVIIGSAILGLLLLTVFYLQSRRLNRKLAQEKERSEQLLLNILPKDIADELKKTGNVEPRFYELGTVIFTDFVGFSQIAQQLPSDQLIQDLDECFQAFDQLADEYGIEKIKTIGDAYMGIGGVPTPDAASVRSVIRFALALQQELAKWNAIRASEGAPLFQARIGIHTGPVVAGVVGIRKFSYDVWGETVNIASRMESQGAAGKVNVSGATYQLVKDDFQFTERGAVEIKNMEPMQMYFVGEGKQE